MTTLQYYKRALGIIICLNILPTICGFIVQAEEKVSFLKGFLFGWEVIFALGVFAGFIMLIMWCFGAFE